MKKVVSTLLLAGVTSQLFGIESNQIEGVIKYRQLIDAQENGFEPNTGSAIGINLNYNTESYQGFQGHLGFFFDGSIEAFMDRDGSEKTNNTTKKITSGYFLSSDNKTRSILSQAYVSYKGEDFLLKAGRRAYDQKSKFENQNPMSRLKVSVVPNLVESYGVEYSGIEGTTLGFEHITKLALGSRSMPDCCLIGEFTGTAGAVNSPMNYKGDFTNLGELAGVDDTAGITVLSAMKNIGDLKIQAWNYYGHEISNVLYSQADYSHKVGGAKVTYSAQWLNQKGVGDGKYSDLKSDLVGMKIAGKYKNFMPYFAFNSSSGDKFLNYFGMDPAFTSSIYSRNAYREEVTAYKLGFSYKFLKKFKAVLSYSDYGKSKTKFKEKFSATSDATETDIVLAYKPQKNLVIKLLKVFRTSEYDNVVINGVKKDRTMDTTRIAVDYRF